MSASPPRVIPAKAGTHVTPCASAELGPRLRGDDTRGRGMTSRCAEALNHAPL